ncbi:MAG: hypothetical protein GX060_03265 [Firmicutes bacterium]|nr:hypothetical protein [Bacillota bacterium]
MFKWVKNLLAGDSQGPCPSGLVVWQSTTALWRYSQELAARARQIKTWDELDELCRQGKSTS